MRSAKILLLAIALAPAATTFAQRGGNGYGNSGYGYNQNETSILSIFSEEGDPFFLVLNGVKQNLVPQSKIRVEALPQYLNDVQIVFTDRNTPPLRKKVTVSDPVDGRAVNLTLKVGRGRAGMPRLKFVRMTECDRNYRGPRDEYVMYYGKPQQINTVTETTYTDPVTGQVVTQTTTTTSDGYNDGYGNNGGYNGNGYGNNGGGYGNNGGYNPRTTTTPPPPPAPVAMDNRTFMDAKKSIGSASFDDTKLSTAKTILASNYVTTDQVMEICKMFSFEDNKLKFAEYAYDRTVDQRNYFKLASIFNFDSNKTELNDFIRRNQR